MKDILVYLIIGVYVYGWYLIFFDRGYLDSEGNQITRKQWKRLQMQDRLYH